MSAHNEVSKLTLRHIQKMKAEGEKFACLTAYDAAFAAAVDRQGVDITLVGDSLGMVVQGLSTTIPVSMDELIYHSKMVARGLSRSMLMVDMPFMSYATPNDALKNAARLMKEGMAEIVKLEWGELQLETVGRFNECGIPVCAHLGLTPQSYFKIGGYRVQGRDEDTAERMREDAKALVEAGADMLLLECVPKDLAAQITADSDVPVIGIGAGADVDGQILVLYDILDIAPGKRTRFSKNYIAEASGIHGAIKQYVDEVKSMAFPAEEHTF